MRWKFRTSACAVGEKRERRSEKLRRQPVGRRGGAGEEEGSSAGAATTQLNTLAGFLYFLCAQCLSVNETGNAQDFGLLDRIWICGVLFCF